MRKPSTRTSVIAGVAAFVMLGGSALGYAGYETVGQNRSIFAKDVTLVVDGQVREVSTRENTVGAFLASQDIVVGERDTLAPGADAKLSEGSEIAVAFGRKVELSVDGTPRTVWTTQRTVAGVMNQLNIREDAGALSASRNAVIGRDGMSLSLATTKNVSLTVGGKAIAAKTTGMTVADALKSAKVTLGAQDKLTPAATTKIANGAKITVVRVKNTTETKPVTLAFKKTTKQDSSLDKGTKKVVTEGKAGTANQVWKLTWNDNKVVDRTLISTKVAKAPVAEVTAIGTKKVEARTESESSSRESSSSSSSNSSSSNLSPARGASCGASYYDTGAVTANGERYRPDGITAAHKSLPFGTRVKVTYGGRSVIVRINDRGPFVGGRCLDLSRGAFRTIAPLGAGVIRVTYQIL